MCVENDPGCWYDGKNAMGEMRMHVKRRAFLQGAKPLLQELIGRLSQRYGYVSVLAADTRGKFFNVANTGVNAGEEDLFTRRGFVLKV